MTDKLPEWVDDWIDSHMVPDDFGRPAVLTDDLRAFLAQFVLCEKSSRPCGFCSDGYSITRGRGGNVKTDCPRCSGTGKLHAPAKGLPEASDTQEQTR